MKTNHGNRVLMLLENSSYTFDGRVRREASALRDAGYQVTVICPRVAGQASVLDFDGVLAYQYTSLSIGSGFLGYVTEYVWALMATTWLSLVVLIRHGFDVIHAHNPPDLFVLLAMFYKLAGKQFVFDHHDLAPDMYRARFGSEKKIVFRVLLLLERWSCHFADQVIATNESYQRLQVERAGISPDKITIVRNGPEDKHFEPVEPHHSLRGFGKAVIGYVGEMGVQDGVEYLIRSLAHLRNNRGRTDWFAVLVGSGDMQMRLKRLASDLGIGEDILFTGRVSPDDVVPFLSGMDICTVPDPSNSYNDHCTMIKVMEYMAQGKPTVAFDLPETRFSAGESGLYVAPNDEASFAAALEQLIDDPVRRQRLGTVARVRAEAELAWKHSVPNLLSVYERLRKPAHANASALHEVTDRLQTLHTSPTREQGSLPTS